MLRDDQLRLVGLCALEGVTGAQWQTIARQAEQHNGLERLLAGDVDEDGQAAEQLRRHLEWGLPRLDEHIDRSRTEAASAERVGARLVTVLDRRTYPLNLRRVHDRPPFLWVLGRLVEEDLRAIAVVGTRSATPSGLRSADRLARGLAEQDVTVVSGMAAGIDSAAHESALEAGGRTIAVMGTGILRCYPAANAALRDRIAEHGAVVSQFFPNQPPTRQTFPLRNVVTSGVSQGTVVVEASSTSGAKMQARLAARHGKQVLLVKSLVTSQQWARDYIERRMATEVDDVADVLARIRPPEQVRAAAKLREQLTLQFA